MEADRSKEPSPLHKIKPALSFSARDPCSILSFFSFPLYVLHEFCHKCSQIAFLTVRKMSVLSFPQLICHPDSRVTAVLHVHHMALLPLLFLCVTSSTFSTESRQEKTAKGKPHIECDVMPGQKAQRIPRQFNK